MHSFIRKLMKRFGAAGASALITLFSIAAAVLITFAIYALEDQTGTATASLVVTPLVAALLIAPPASYFALRLLESLIEAEDQNKQLISRLSAALDDVKRLSGLLPICAHCKNICDEEGSWHQLEVYVTNFSEAKFSHDICPRCVEENYPEFKD